MDWRRVFVEVVVLSTVIWVRWVCVLWLVGRGNLWLVGTGVGWICEAMEELRYVTF